MSLSVNPITLSYPACPTGDSPVTVTPNTASGKRMALSVLNFWRGNILPRATPVKSGTKHSISVILLSVSHLSMSAN